MAKQTEFERYTSGAQLFLSDGSVWRVAGNYQLLPVSWTAGDPIVFDEAPAGMTHLKELTNLSTGEMVRAMRSSRV